MKVGFAERDITPEFPSDRGPGQGHYGPPIEEGVHDRCKAKAAVFDDGACRVALVSCDIESMLRSVVLGARADVEAACGIPQHGVLVAATHSHSAGCASVVEPDLFAGASDLARHLALDFSGCPSREYLAVVRRQIVAAVAAADREKADARCAVGSGHEDAVSFNLRFRMKNGRIASAPGKGNPDIVAPAGPIDPEVGVLGSWDTQGRFLGCVVNFACHPHTAPGGVSADWIHYLDETIRRAMGRDAVVVFLNGACGDIGHIDWATPGPLERGEQAARRVGQSIGGEAIKVLAKAEPRDLGPVAARQEVLRIIRRVPSPDRLRRCLAACQGDLEAMARNDPEWRFIKGTILLDAMIQADPLADVEVQSIQIGPAVFLANPCESFCRLGLEVKASSHFPHTFTVDLANGCAGYACTEDAFGEDGGGLETRLWEYSNLAPTAGRQIVDACLRLARGLSPGQTPTPPQATPGRAGPWSMARPELE